VPPTDARLAVFLAASLALALTPGPAVLFIVARSLELGRRGGLRSVAGVALGNAVHAAGTALGLAAVLASSPVAFAVVRYAGAGYLAVLGLRKLLAPADDGARKETPAPPPPPAAAVRQGFLVAVLNPKTALFFLAFLPQFADASRGALGGQLLVLGGIFVTIGVCTDSGYALLAGAMGAFLRGHPGLVRLERRAAGLVYLGLGILAAVAGAGG
jgi:threonine/homoserine/homoserine lactone efflux protein